MKRVNLRKMKPRPIHVKPIHVGAPGIRKGVALLKAQTPRVGK